MSVQTLPSKPGAEESPKSHFANESLFLLSLIVVFGIFASSMPQPQGLGSIPLKNLLKNELHASPEQVSSFVFWIGFFWYFKPLAGILTDAFPFMRTRRRHYLLFSSVLAAGSWILIGMLPHTYMALLYGCIFLSLFVVMMSTVTGAFLVEVGQSRQATGRLSAVRQVTHNACHLLNGPLGGLLAGGAFAIVAGVNAVLVLSIFPVAYFLLKEKPGAVRNPDAFKNAGKQVRTLATSGPFWLAIAFTGLFFFAPGINTLQFFREQDIMHLSTKQQGSLASVSAMGGILAAITYGVLVRRISIRPLLLFGIATAATGSVLFIWYNNMETAIPIQFQNGVFFGFAEVALIDLAARATPAGCEGLGYSCLLSVRNISVFGADRIGTGLAHSFHWGWSTMVWLNAATTAVVLVLLPFMPRKLMGSRDGSAPNAEPALA